VESQKSYKRSGTLSNHRFHPLCQLVTIYWSETFCVLWCIAAVKQDLMSLQHGEALQESLHVFSIV